MRASRSLLLALLLLLLGSACGGADHTTPAAPAVADVAETVEGESSGDIGAASREVDAAQDHYEFAQGVDPEGVVTAALLIASGGDLEAAINSGLVDELDAETAIRALESGSLDELFD
jgi:hypothetical protein